MSLTITRRRERIEKWSYSLNFDTDETGGFSFPCDKNGVVITEGMAPEGMANLALCQSGEIKTIRAPYVNEYVSRYSEPAQGKCECGNTVTLWGDRECDCGRMFNMFGQEITRMGFNDLPGEDY